MISNATSEGNVPHARTGAASSRKATSLTSVANRRTPHDRRRLPVTASKPPRLATLGTACLGTIKTLESKVTEQRARIAKLTEECRTLQTLLRRHEKASGAIQKQSDGLPAAMAQMAEEARALRVQMQRHADRANKSERVLRECHLEIAALKDTNAALKLKFLPDREDKLALPPAVLNRGACKSSALELIDTIPTSVSPEQTKPTAPCTTPPNECIVSYRESEISLDRNAAPAVTDFALSAATSIRLCAINSQSLQANTTSEAPHQNKTLNAASTPIDVATARPTSTLPQTSVFKPNFGICKPQDGQSTFSKFKIEPKEGHANNGKNLVEENQNTWGPAPARPKAQPIRKSLQDSVGGLQKSPSFGTPMQADNLTQPNFPLPLIATSPVSTYQFKPVAEPRPGYESIFGAEPVPKFHPLIDE